MYIYFESPEFTKFYEHFVNTKYQDQYILHLGLRFLMNKTRYNHKSAQASIPRIFIKCLKKDYNFFTPYSCSCYTCGYINTRE